MKHHSLDYKLTAVKHYLKSKDTIRKTCKIFNCKYQSLYRWSKKYKKDKNLKRKLRSNKNIKITPDIKQFVKDKVKINPSITLWELSKLVNEEFKIELTDSSIHNILQSNKITRKRLRSKYYPEKVIGQEENALNNFYNTLKNFKYDKTICLDETSIYLNMTLPYGRCRSGSRCVKKTNIYPFKRYNLLCAISSDKIVGCTLYKDIKGGLKTNNILDFLNKYIKDKYKNYLIIMNNAVIHKSHNIKDLIESTGNKLLYSVPYNPSTNAIEEFFSQLKHYIKKESPKTVDDIEKVLIDIIKNKIKKEHLEKYLKHSFRLYN
jgi:transposase